MTIQLALRTLYAMDQSMRIDQGAAYRRHLGQVLPHIRDAYRPEEEGFRSHLGASQLGQECDRALWYGWRWFTKSSFNGKMLRLFNRGHLEEGRFIALLLTCGLQIYQQDEKGNQFRISHLSGHIGGSGDGVLVGVPDLPAGIPALGEFKTHGEKSFKELAGDNWAKFLDFTFGFAEDPTPQQFTGVGVKEAKIEHYVQMQLYMFKMGLTVCLYVACNKNTDEIYCELVPLDTLCAEMFLRRGEKIVRAEHPPSKINQSPGFWKCKFCDHKPVCHLKAEPARNCRTCVHSSPELEHSFGDGEWVCNSTYNGAPISKEIQLNGCHNYTPRQ